MKDILNPWVVAGAVIVASLLLVITFLAAGTIIPSDQLTYYGEAALTVIPVPTQTPTVIPPTPAFNPTIEPNNGIQVGGYVKITGTEGDGLRFRREPTLNGDIIYLALEDEVFLVKDGPEDRDGYLWWYLEAPLNVDVNGWAVSNFLIVDQNP
ncbi:MAG: hypothetical protein MUO54_06050 [Anaerolineales bacterium]|nr:hypothetical protein [Anaerolineales bacterium]